MYHYRLITGNCKSLQMYLCYGFYVDNICGKAMKKFTFILVLLVILIQSPLSQAQDEPSLVGRWYGQSWSWEGRVQHDFLKLWIADHKPDGVFEVSFYKCNQEGLEFIVAYSGEWELVNGYLSTIYNQRHNSDGGVSMAPSHHLYKVDSITYSLFSYKHVDSGMPYQSKRVDQDEQALCQSLLM